MAGFYSYAHSQGLRCAYAKTLLDTTCTTPFLRHFLLEHDHFTKTGSGQTQGNLKRRLVFLHSVYMNDHPMANATQLSPAEVKFRYDGLTSLFDLGLDFWWYLLQPTKQTKNIPLISLSSYNAHHQLGTADRQMLNELKSNVGAGAGTTRTGTTSSQVWRSMQTARSRPAHTAGARCAAAVQTDYTLHMLNIILTSCSHHAHIMLTLCII